MKGVPGPTGGHVVAVGAGLSRPACALRPPHVRRAKGRGSGRADDGVQASECGVGRAARVASGAGHPRAPAGRLGGDRTARHSGGTGHQDSGVRRFHALLRTRTTG